MRMSKAAVEVLRAAIVPLDTDCRRRRYLDADFPRATSVQDVDRRYRWDLLWLVIPSVGWDTIDGLDDSHIDTGLRRIVPPLEG